MSGIKNTLATTYAASPFSVDLLAGTLPVSLHERTGLPFMGRRPRNPSGWTNLDELGSPRRCLDLPSSDHVRQVLVGVQFDPLAPLLRPALRERVIP